MAEESHGFYVIVKIGELLVTLMVALVLIMIAQSFILREVDASRLEARLAAYNTLYSPELQAGSLGLPSLDTGKLGPEILENGQRSDRIGMELRVKTRGQEWVAYRNRKLYEAAAPLAASSAKSCAVSDWRDLPVLVNGELAHAEVRVVSERGISRCA